MKKILGISLFAMMAVTTANAEIASRAYVDGQIGALPENSNVMAEINAAKTAAATDATATVKGIMKLYSETGSATDGTMTQGAITTALGTKQDTITTTAKLGADLVDDSTSTNKFVTAADRAQITTNANAINTLNGADTEEGSVAKTVKDAIAANNTTNAATTVTHTANTAAGSATNPVYIAENGTATAITSYPAANVTPDADHRFVTDAEKTTWNAKQNAISDVAANSAAGVVTQVTQTSGQIAVTKAQITDSEVASNAAIDMAKIAMPKTIADGTAEKPYGTYSLTADITDSGITYKWELIRRNN